MLRTQIAALIVPTQPDSPDSGDVGNAKAGDNVVLSPIAGKSITGWIVDAALAASVRRVGVIANNPPVAARSEVAARSDEALIEFVTPRSSITDTLMMAVERLGPELTLSDFAHVLILPAESPQIGSSELRSLIEHHIGADNAATLLSAPLANDVDEPTIVRDADGQIVSIIDADDVAPAIMCIRASLLIPALHRAIAPRWQHGAPLAEIAGVLTELGHTVGTIEREQPIASITSAATRAPIEMALRDRIVAAWIERGVSMPDPRQVSIDATVTLGKGVQVLPGTMLEGSTVIGDGATIGPNAHLIDSSIGCGAIVPHCVARDAEVPARHQVRPFSVLGAGTS